MEKRSFKNKIYRELARIVKALSNPHRLEILELLAQGPYSVAQIAGETELSTANASQHLQVLKRVQLVRTERKGNFIYYRLTDQNVYKAWKALRDLGMERMAEIERVIRSFRESRHSLESLSTSELMRKMEKEDITLLDVRPESEYQEGHITGALNIPVDALTDQLDELPAEGEIVAYCRGPFCVFADQAVELLREKGFDAKRLDEGYPDWMIEQELVE